MAEVASADQARRGGFGRGFGGRGGRGGDRRGGREGGDRGGRGGRGGDRGGRGGRGGGRGGDKGEAEWIPVTKLGRLVKDKLIGSIEELYLHSLPVKEYQIIDSFFPEQQNTPSILKDEVMKIMPVQKQTQAGQRTRFKAFVLVGDKAGHVGLGVKCSKEVATAIRGAIILAKLSVIPVRRGYWGNNIGAVHTVPTKVTGKCGSVRVRLVPAPRGTGIVAARVPKKLLTMSGIEDVYTAAKGSTKTLGNFVKATFNAIKQTYAVLTPDLWPRYALTPAPVFVHAKYLASVKNLPTKKGKDFGGDDERRGGDRGDRGFRGGYGGDRREGGFGDRGGFRGGRGRGGYGGDRGEGQEGEGGFGGRRGGFGGRGGYGGDRGFGGRGENQEGGEGGFGGRGDGERREGFGGRGGFRGGRGRGFGGGDRGFGGRGGFGAGERLDAGGAQGQQAHPADQE